MYKLTQGTSIIRADGASIPADPDNLDYVAYLKWVEVGNVAEPADPVPVVEPQPTIQELIDVLPKESKDALAAKLATK